MTYDEVMALPLRRLDALVAEKVEGLSVVWAPDPYRVPDRRLTDHHPWLQSNGAIDGMVRTAVKRYSTSWNAMKHVIETMHRRGWSCRLISSSTVQRDGIDQYWAGFTHDNGAGGSSGSDFMMGGADAPTAVARAALFAIDGGVNNDEQE